MGSYALNDLQLGINLRRSISLILNCPKHLFWHNQIGLAFASCLHYVSILSSCFATLPITKRVLLAPATEPCLP